MVGSISPARKGELDDPAAAPLKPRQVGRARRLEKLELDRSLCLLLHAHRPSTNATARDEVTDLGNSGLFALKRPPAHPKHISIQLLDWVW